LQQGRENANIDAGLGFIWRISDESDFEWPSVKLQQQQGVRKAIWHRIDVQLAEYPILRDDLAPEPQSLEKMC
jgi:hypothetical protein